MCAFIGLNWIHEISKNTGVSTTLFLNPGVVGREALNRRNLRGKRLPLDITPILVTQLTRLQRKPKGCSLALLCVKCNVVRVPGMIGIFTVQEQGPGKWKHFALHTS
jgi:hypothetical protein